MSFTLLLADDSVTTHRVMELTFAGQGIHVVSVADGDQVMERMRLARPDIVLAEVALPRVDGYRIATHVRSMPVLATVPVLLLTGAFDVVDEARVRASGADGIIVKPFEPEAVIKRVKDLLGISSNEPTTRLVTPSEPPPRSSGGLAGTATHGAGEEGVAASVTMPNHTAAGEERRQSVVSERSALSGGQANRDASFDELDEAFDSLDKQLSTSGLGQAAQPHRTSTPATTAAVPPAASQPPVLEFDEEWFPGIAHLRPSEAGGSAGPAAPPMAPGGRSSGSHIAAETDTSPSGHSDPRATYGTPPRLHAFGLPDVAETFQALLAAEQGGAAPVPVRETITIPDETIERIAIRVAERLSDGVLGDTLRRVVADVAERLVREEIARIRARVDGQRQP